MMDEHLIEQLKAFGGGHTCLLGIGNRQWRDDGVGSMIAEALQDCGGFSAIDAGFIPENHLETVAGENPESILLVDATDFGGEPGQARFIEADKVSYAGLSTHAGSLRVLSEYLQARTGARVALLAIQPGDTSAGEGLSAAVSATLDALLEALPDICGRSGTLDAS